MEQELKKTPHKIHILSDLLREDLVIPPYQRPYKWTANKNVKQLLEDIIREAETKHSEYRMGTIILHEDEKSKLNIVDGQQRLVTTSLILLALNYRDSTLLNQEFDHSVSRDNIKFNYGFIEHYLDQLNQEEKEKIKTFLLQKCTFVVVKLKYLPEAFQLFDSQNARGKSLDPADLLKAFHLREMESETSFETKDCVVKWEKSIQDKILNEVIGGYLFRLRSWERKEWNYTFTKDDLQEFKGVNILKSLKEGREYPYLRSVLQNSYSSNYQINEPIVNGKRFFNYIQHYVELYQRLIEFKKTINLPFEYTGSNRIGDKRLNSFYGNILMYYIDKFGFDQQLVQFSKELYRMIFLIRLESSQIRYATIVNKLKYAPNAENPMVQIRAWYYPDIISFKSKLKKINKSSIKKEIEAIIVCIEKIENNG